MLGGIVVYRLFRATVNPPVGLLVSREPLGAQPLRAGHRLFGDGARPGAFVKGRDAARKKDDAAHGRVPRERRPVVLRWTKSLGAKGMAAGLSVLRLARRVAKKRPRKKIRFCNYD